jgi:transcriptional regulator with XRE-family HTH domain
VSGRGEPGVDQWLRALGKRVRILRLTKELTQDELAVASGMSRSFVSIIEHGTHGVDVVRLLRLAAALDIPLSELLGDLPRLQPVRASPPG